VNSSSHRPVVHPAVIIGAGHFGLAIAHELQQRGLSVPVLDAADLGDVSRYAGKRVLVVGCGTSGSDALNHLAQVDTRELLVSVRHGVGPAFDPGFAAALKAGRIRAVPPVRGFDGPHVLLADGNRVQPDVFICATGYRPGLESMVGHLGVLDGRGIPRTFGRGGQSQLPGLRFVGMTPKLTGRFRGHRAAGPLRQRRAERVRFRARVSA